MAWALRSAPPPETGLTGPERFAVFSQGLWAFTGSSKTGISLNKPRECENSIPRVSQVVSSEKEAASCLISERGASDQQVTTRPCHQQQCGNHTDPGAAHNSDPARGERGHLLGLLYGLQRWGPSCGPRGLPSQETALWAQRRPRVWCLQPSPSVVDTEQVVLRGLVR